MEDFKTTCPYCGQKFKFRSDQTGEDILCSKCLHTFTVPEPPKAETFVFTCPSCKQEMDIETEWIGKDGECPHCGKNIEIKPPNAANHPASHNLRKDPNPDLQPKLSPQITPFSASNSKHPPSDDTPSNLKKILNTDLLELLFQMSPMLKLGSALLVFLLIIVVIRIFPERDQVQEQSHSSSSQVANTQASTSQVPKPQTEPPTDSYNKVNNVEIETKESQTINIKCYLVNSRNQEIIPFCDVSICDYSDELNEQIQRYHKAHENVETQKMKVVPGDFLEELYKDLVKVAKSTRELSLIGIGNKMKDSIAGSASFRNGNCTFENAEAKSYLMWATATYDNQRLHWFKKITKEKGIPYNLVLTKGLLINN